MKKKMSHTFSFLSFYNNILIIFIKSDYRFFFFKETIWPDDSFAGLLHLFYATEKIPLLVHSSSFSLLFFLFSCCFFLSWFNIRLKKKNKKHGGARLSNKSRSSAPVQIHKSSIWTPSYTAEHFWKMRHLKMAGADNICFGPFFFILR